MVNYARVQALFTVEDIQALFNCGITHARGIWHGYRAMTAQTALRLANAANVEVESFVTEEPLSEPVVAAYKSDYSALSARLAAEGVNFGTLATDTNVPKCFILRAIENPADVPLHAALKLALYFGVPLTSLVSMEYDNGHPE